MRRRAVLGTLGAFLVAPVNWFMCPKARKRLWLMEDALKIYRLRRPRVDVDEEQRALAESGRKAFEQQSLEDEDIAYFRSKLFTPLKFPRV